jgi:hypothetical protein
MLTAAELSQDFVLIDVLPKHDCVDEGRNDGVLCLIQRWNRLAFQIEVKG